MKFQIIPFLLAGTAAAQDPLPFPPITAPTVALAKFASEAFTEVFFQLNGNKNLPAAIEKYISPKFTLIANGNSLTYDVWHENILKQGDYFSDLVMTDERVVVVPFDDQGKTGQAVHLANITGVEKGLGRFRADCMSNFRIGLKADGSMVIESGDGIAALRAL
ncbi:hypothetical protein B0H63DRAFT_524474 [Podospora didyma]|uniref:SnoaL-like domain-containing protein n=1 Tax=Podospora didyma TaxID=330526 RepID=A0AAE0TW49_9PEZI|nr:hypothetical protein B0H63DRAFT_524474 [Podospora didyma]